MASITQTRMTAAEFAALPESNLPCELVNGEVITAPAPRTPHQKAVFALGKLIERFAPGGEVLLSPLDVYLDEFNTVQPDVFWISGPESTCKLEKDELWHGPPDLVVEIISPGSGNRDKVEKFRLYEKHGVSEYWIVEPKERYIEVWALEGGRFQHRGTFGAGESFSSPVLGGKTIPLAEVFASQP